MSTFDLLYRRILLSRFFTKGWGDPENLRRLFKFRKLLSKRDTCRQMVPSDYPIHIDKEYTQKECRIVEGHFLSPFVHQLPGVMPKEVETASFQMILPTEWTGRFKPMCLHLAGTGDHYFGRRRTLLARPLLKESGIGSIMLENPYYGSRKPKAQMRSSLHYVSDLFVMGGALVLESLALFHWCERNGYGPLGITGISMGGHMASLAASGWHKPIALIPCLSWSTASVIFTEGVLAKSIPWKLLQKQYSSDRIYGEELQQHIVSPELNRRHDEAFHMGQEFVKKYSQDMEELQNLSHNENVVLNTVNSDNNTQTQDYSASNQSNLNKFYNKLKFWESLRKKKSKQLSEAESLTLDFMWGVMDECTHLGNFSIPVDPELIIIVVATYDAYTLRNNVIGLEEIWPGSEVRYLDQGHIMAFLTQQKSFRQAIVDGFDRLTEKYHS